MAGLGPAIHEKENAWIPGPSPGMTSGQPDASSASTKYGQSRRHREYSGVTSDSLAPALPHPALLATPGYLRLWFAGGIGNAMRWLELLVAGVFTYDVTHSTFLVALVTVARSLPMLLAGALAGVIGEALNRKRILVMQLLVMATTSAVLCGLALLGEVRVWQIILAGFVNGLVWASELA